MSQSEEVREEVLRGVVERVTFYDTENNFAVIQLSVDQQPNPITVTGPCLKPKPGAHLAVRGRYVTHPKFGVQFAARWTEEIEPSSEEGLKKYLSGFIQGIGAKTAHKLVTAFGAKTLEIIFQNPDLLTTVPGLGKRKAEMIRQALLERRERIEIDRFLAEHNISRGLTNRLYERYGARAIEVLKEDPYILAYEMHGVGFATADAIALSLGVNPDAPQRLKAGLYYALERSADDGHSFLEGASLAARARHLLGLAGYYDFGPYLEELLNEGLVAKDGDAFYLKQLLEAENFVAAFVADRCAARPSNLTKELVAACLAKSQHELNIKYTFEQREAVFLATTSPLLIITGGPGCGKTTTIRALAAAFQAMGKVLALAAPTGKAAQRMAQLCSYPASTIHRLLKFDPRSGRFKYGINAPLCVGDADERRVEALIIDETSMVDLALAKDLFAAIPKDAHLVLVGDKDQLPSVGPGRVFAELLSTPQIKKVVLSQIFRRSDESGITTAAHSINSGIVPNIPVPDGITRSDIYLIERSDPEEAARMVENLVADQIPKKFNFSSTDITVLTPSNRGPLGTIQLNRRLQERLNPPKPNRKELEVRGEKFRLRDRVCQRVNNYQIDQEGVFNGDTGEIYTIDTQKKSMQVELWDGRLINYEGANLSQLSLCYALSVHRSQGSEMPCVVLVLHESHYSLLERQLLYTAVTRAKQLLIVVSTRKALSIATRRATTKRRCTRLQARIEALLASTDISSELEVTST